MDHATYQRLLDHVLQDRPFQPLLRSAQRSRHQAQWREFVVEHKSRPPRSCSDSEYFHDHWHVCHHYLRELVDDEGAVMNMLRIWLPRYKGADRVLYRGENLDRMEAGRLGIAWSDEIETAMMFARALNAVGTGGVLLRAQAPARAIIAGPSEHSLRIEESEFTVDPRELTRIEQLQRFSPVV